MNSPPSRPPRTGCDFPLEPFEHAMQCDARVLGLLYSGSRARGVADRYSDLDIDAWVTPDASADVDVMLEAIVGALGPLHFMYTRGPAFVTAFVGDDWQRVDLHLHPAADTKTHAEYAGGRIVKDWDGTLARIVTSAPAEHVAVSRDDARAVIEEAIDSMLYLTLHNARGEHWSAASEIVERLASSYMLLAAARGRASYGLRYVTAVLTGEEQTMLTRAWPASPEHDEVRRAARELWTWIRFVWLEVERSLGRPLDIELDDTAMLRAIDTLYAADAAS